MFTELFNRASKNFRDYLKVFQDQGVVKMFPADRLSTQEWNTLNKMLQSHKVVMMPVEKNGVRYMKFAKLEDAMNAADGFKNATKRVATNFGAKLQRYTGFKWEHKTSDTSNLGYEHYRLNIDNMNSTQVQYIINELNKRAISVGVRQTNKGKFIILNIDEVINVKPHGYTPSKVMFDKVYRPQNFQMTQNIQNELMNILTMPIPKGVNNLSSPEMRVHTDKVISRYAKIGALSKSGIDNLSNDLHKNLISEFIKVPSLSAAIVNWQRLSKSVRIDTIKQMNYIIGSMHRNHVGNTVINFGDDYYAQGGFNPDGGNSFAYNTSNLDNFDNVLDTLVHENVHGFQSVGLSSIEPSCNEFQRQNYNSEDTLSYINIIEEAEARYVANKATHNFYVDFIRQYNQNYLHNNMGGYRE